MLPEKTNACWKNLASGKKPLTTENLGLQMLLKRVLSKASASSAAEIEKGAGELFDFFVKYERILVKEVAALK